MRYIKAGRSDLNLSCVGIGGFSFGTAGWMVGKAKASEILKQAMDLGINYIDTANVYSGGESERIIGKVIEGVRDELVISTKVGGPMGQSHYGFSRKELSFQIRGSLERLGTDFIDIYFLHTWFDHLDVRETAATLDSFVRSGKASYYGLSNVAGYQLAEIDTMSAEKGIERPVMVQNHFNAVYREDERDTIPYCRLKRITYSPFSPLAAGFLSGKYSRGKIPQSTRAKEYKLMTERYFSKNDFDVLDSVKSVAEETGLTPSSTALSYVLHKGFLPVVGISDPEHLGDVEDAIGRSLSREQIRRIEENYVPHPVFMGTAGY